MQPVSDIVSICLVAYLLRPAFVEVWSVAVCCNAEYCPWLPQGLGDPHIHRVLLCNLATLLPMLTLIGQYICLQSIADQK